MARRLIKRGPGDRAPGHVRKRGSNWHGECIACGWDIEGLFQTSAFWATFTHVKNHHTYNLEG